VRESGGGGEARRAPKQEPHDSCGLSDVHFKWVKNVIN
jgi:hypothetical protein